MKLGSSVRVLVTIATLTACKASSSGGAADGGGAACSDSLTGCGELVGPRGFAVQSVLSSGVVAQPSADSKDIVVQWSDAPCTCPQATAVQCPRAAHALILDMSRSNDAGDDFSGTYAMGLGAPEPHAFLELLTYLADGGIARDEYVAEPPTGQLELVVGDGGLSGSFSTTVSLSDGGAPTPLSGTFQSVACPAAFVPVSF